MYSGFLYCGDCGSPMFAMSRIELKATKRQRIRDIMKRPDQEATLEDTYDGLESDLLRRMEGLQNQIAITVDKRNTIIQVNRAAKTALEVFDDILTKPKLDRNDLQLVIQKIMVYEDHLDIQLHKYVNDLFTTRDFQRKPADEIEYPSKSCG